MDISGVECRFETLTFSVFPAQHRNSLEWVCQKFLIADGKSQTETININTVKIDPVRRRSLLGVFGMAFLAALA